MSVVQIHVRFGTLRENLMSHYVQNTGVWLQTLTFDMFVTKITNICSPVYCDLSDQRLGQSQAIGGTYVRP